MIEQNLNNRINFYDSEYLWVFNLIKEKTQVHKSIYFYFICMYFDNDVIISTQNVFILLN